MRPCCIGYAATVMPTHRSAYPLSTPWSVQKVRYGIAHKIRARPLRRRKQEANSKKQFGISFGCDGLRISLRWRLRCIWRCFGGFTISTHSVNTTPRFGWCHKRCAFSRLFFRGRRCDGGLIILPPILFHFCSGSSCSPCLFGLG